MAIRIMFDAANKPEEPTIVLARRNGDKIGAINAKEISLSDSLNDAPELSFKVYKELDGEKCALWDEITNFKLIYCVEWNTWFEMTVELDENDETVKTVFCTGLGYAELGQIMLYTIEINTEEDIARDDYKEPTVLFNEKNPKASLLHRIMEKAPHYTITHVDASIAGIQRTFSFDDTSIYDAFQDIAEEIKCIFILNASTDGEGRLQRTIEVYDLQSYCFDCGHRGDYFDTCPECGSSNVRPGYGEDTTIFITSDELADNIGFTTDTDAVKNCFKLEGGDDLMTATIRNCNPNGTDYLWYFSDDMKKDMPDDLVERIESYDDIYRYYQSEHVVIPGNTDSVAAYNSLVDKYRVFNEDLEKIEVPVKGYSELMHAYYNTIDLNLYLTNSMMPSVETIETDATKELAKLTTAALSPVAVQNISVISDTTADNVVISMAKLIVDSRFKVKVGSSSIVKSSNSCIWTGNFVVTNYYDDEDTATGGNIRVIINDDFEEFVKEKVEKQLSKEGDGEVDIVGLFSMTYDNFVNELRKYSLNRLRSFYASCQACLDVLIEQGVADKESWDGESPNLYYDLYYPYLQKQNAISAEISIREQEISIIVGERDADGDLTTYGLQNYLDIYRDEIQANLDFENYLGEELWLEFCAFRREDKYSNDNYISDSLNNRELFDKAQEFLDRATEEIHKSAEQQHSITSDLKNLLIIDKFKPLVDKFSVGNWLRIMVNDTLYKLRLLNYEIDYDNIEDMSVEFSDVIRAKDSASDIQSVLDQASDMATSYDSVKRQAEQGKNGNDKLNGWVNEGLSLTNMTIVGDADNQNMQWDSHGMLLREYLPITNTYDDRQLKIINRGLYVTDDNWTTSRAGIGNFRFYNPKTKEYEDAYGVIADTIVGNIVLSEEVGIYNKNNSITMDGDGLHITTSADALKNSDVFVIQKENKQPDGSVMLDKLLYFDNNGNLTINGSVRVYSNGSSTPSTDTTLGDVINATTEAIDKVDVEYALGDSFAVAPVLGWSTNSPVWEEGKYVWQRTATTSVSGQTTYSKPVCIQGAKGEDGIKGESSYIHIKYAPIINPSDDQMTGTPDRYIGICVDTNPADPTTALSYTWSLFMGKDGSDGTPAQKVYVHFAYANSEDGSKDFSTTQFDDAKYIGVLSNNDIDDSLNYQDYTWSQIRGDDGINGTDGTIIHIKYSDVPNPTDEQMTETPSKYIGICVDYNIEDPTTALSYTWSKFEGDDGAAGVSSYVHFAYSTSADGSQDFSTSSFDGAIYIGVYTDSIKEDSDDYLDYTWSLIKGADGLDGLGIKSIEEQYYLSVSNLEQTGGSWSSEQPEWESGKYIWTRSKVTWSDDSVSYTAPTLANAINGAYSYTDSKFEVLSDKITMSVSEGIAEANSYTDSQIQISADNITSTVSETYATKTALSEVKQTADGLSVRLENTEDAVANIDANIDDAAKVATNYLEYTSSGLTVGNKSSGSWSGTRVRMGSSAVDILNSSGTSLASYGSTTRIGSTSGYNTYIDSSGMKIRNGSTVLSSFGSNSITLGRTTGSSILLSTSGGLQILQNNRKKMVVDEAIEFYDANGICQYVLGSGFSFGVSVAFFIKADTWGAFDIRCLNSRLVINSTGLTFSSLQRGIEFNSVAAVETVSYAVSSAGGTWSMNVSSLVTTSELQYVCIYYTDPNGMYNMVKVPLRYGEEAYTDLKSMRATAAKELYFFTECIRVVSSGYYIRIYRNQGPAMCRAMISPNGNSVNIAPGTLYTIQYVTLCFGTL